jgi:hypothetical protein
MTNEEREIITGFLQRVSGASVGAPGSVPSAAPALPPVDREADALIGDLFARLPDARYRLTQTAFVQEHALAEAQNRIKSLEYELDQAKRAAQTAPQGFGGPQPAAPQPSRGFLGGLFGGGQSAPPPQPQYQQPQYQQPQYQPPPPPPQYAPGYQQGMFQKSGSGFLGSALTTAAGVAGGMVVGNALMDMFSPHRGLGGGLGGGLGETTNVFPAAESSPWGGAAGGQGGSGWDNQTATPDPAASGDSGWGNAGSSGWDNASSTDGGSGGGWDDAGSGIDDSSGGGFDNS